MKCDFRAQTVIAGTLELEMGPEKPSAATEAAALDGNDSPR